MIVIYIKQYIEEIEKIQSGSLYKYNLVYCIIKKTE